MITDIFITLSILFYLIGIIPYMYHIFHGRVVPHAFSWTIWTILSAVNTAGLVSHIWLSYLTVVPIISTIALFFWAVIGWFMIKKIKVVLFDYICLCLALFVVGIVYMKGLSHAIIPSIIVDLLILAPTIRKLWDDPRSEDLIGWLGSGISKLFFIFSLGVVAFSFDNIWWWYVVIVNMSVALLIFYRTRYVENWFNRMRNLRSIFALKKKLW